MPDPLISAEALTERLGAPDLRIFDASWRLDGADTHPGFLAEHLPGARFFPIDGICAPDTDLPHMLPTPEAFAEAAGALGVRETDHIVIYDDGAFHSAPRVWWTFRVFGAANVQVLDGGLRAWKAAGGATESGEPPAPASASFIPHFRPDLVRDYEAVLAAVNDKSEQIVDARPADRFTGAAPEPRAGLASGHMPGARCLPLPDLYHADGTMKDEAGLRAAFATARVDCGAPVITTCGSGIAASALALALARLGQENAAVYDGSWTDYGARPGALVAGGEADEQPG